MDRLAVKCAETGRNALKCAIQLSISECGGFSQVGGWAEGKWVQGPRRRQSPSLAFCPPVQPPQQASLSERQPPLPLASGSQEAGALYFLRPGLQPDLTPGARLVNGGKIPKGMRGGGQEETNILNSLFCKATLLGTLL